MKTKFKYIGKEKDVETAMNINFEGSLADHGVRKFEDYTGRFTTPDVLWEKYYGWSPYQYSLNNPLIFKDPFGEAVFATDSYSQNQVTLSVEKMYQKYISFDNSGKLFFKGKSGEEMTQDELLKITKKNSKSNFATLALVSSGEDVTIKSVDGNTKYSSRIYFSDTFSDESFSFVERSQRIWPYNIYGHTLIHNCTVAEGSSDDNNYIIINKSHPKGKNGKSPAHEFSHYLMYLLGIPYLHTDSGVNEATNKAEEKANATK